MQGILLRQYEQNKGHVKALNGVLQMKNCPGTKKNNPVK